ncbi:hypothetical protein QQ045_014860 [Rhodiola kirilowii]
MYTKMFVLSDRNHSVYSLLLLFCFLSSIQTTKAVGGSWKRLLQNGGVSAMHMQLLNNDKVIIFDHLDFNQSRIMLPKSKCDPQTVPNTTDCSAHSVEYNVASNSIRPVLALTDFWCSSGFVNPNGSLIQTGGFGTGERVIRTIDACANDCDWSETKDALLVKRWYSSVQILPSGEEIVIGGRRQFNYEFYPKTTFKTLKNLPFLSQTYDKGLENNLYPFIFLNTDGFIFIFANNRAILLDYKSNKVVKTYPTIPGGDPRSYPSSGSAALLPLRNLEARTVVAEVLVCGGAPKGSFAQAQSGNFTTALNTCARMNITDAAPAWVMETMPFPRVMGDMTLLPNGAVLIINGASRGTAGWESADAPALTPIMYHHDDKLGSRFETLTPATTARMYHSTSILLRDGRVLIGGSNPHVRYKTSNLSTFPTEVSLDAFSPSYLNASSKALRPSIVLPASQARVAYAKKVNIRFRIGGLVDLNLIMVSLVSPTFTTHSVSMNQRLLILSMGQVISLGKSTYQVTVSTPKSAILAPPGYYLLFVVHQDVPSVGIWVQIQ